MTWLHYPTTSDAPNHTVQTDLDGFPCTFRFVWSTRFGLWSISLETDDETGIYRFSQRLIPLVTGDELDEIVASMRAGALRQFGLFSDLLPGFLAVWSAVPLSRTRGDLDEMRLLYADAAELAP